MLLNKKCHNLENNRQRNTSHFLIFIYYTFSARIAREAKSNYVS